MPCKITFLPLKNSPPNNTSSSLWGWATNVVLLLEVGSGYLEQWKRAESSNTRSGFHSSSCIAIVLAHADIIWLWNSCLEMVYHELYSNVSTPQARILSHHLGEGSSHFSSTHWSCFLPCSWYAAISVSTFSCNTKGSWGIKQLILTSYAPRASYTEWRAIWRAA